MSAFCHREREQKEMAIFSNLKLHLPMNSIKDAILFLLRMRKMAAFIFLDVLATSEIKQGVLEN